MSGRSYEKKEVVQWSYTALVCIALCFASITGASANTKSAEVRPTFSEKGNWGACLVPIKAGETTAQETCDTTAATSTDATYGLNQILNSAWVNTGAGLNFTNYPWREDRTY